MEYKEFTAREDDSGRRLDRVIRKFIPEQNLSSIYKTIRKGLVKVNDKKSKPDSKVQENDVIKIAAFLLEERQQNSTQSNRNINPVDTRKKEISSFENHTNKTKCQLNVVFQNEDIIIFDKPYDIVVHGGNDSFADIASAYILSIRDKSSMSFTPGPLHRLDRKTTGLIAFSKSLKGAKWFSENIANHSIKKSYISIIQGKLEKKEIWIDYIEKKDNEKSSFFTVEATRMHDKNSPMMKKAITEIEPLSYGKYKDIDITFVKVEIQTGRTHQIRAQSSLHKHPLLGDVAYGGNKISGNRDFYLHAYKLSMPETNPLNLPKVIQLEIPSDFLRILSSSNCEIIPTVL